MGDREKVRLSFVRELTREAKGRNLSVLLLRLRAEHLRVTHLKHCDSPSAEISTVLQNRLCKAGSVQPDRRGKTV